MVLYSEVKKTIFIFIAFLVSLSTISCNSKDRQLREALAEHAYEMGFIEGMIFTLEAAEGFLAGTLTSSEINVESEALNSWGVTGINSMEAFCDSSGIELDSALTNSLLGIYRLAFSSGIGEGERYVRELIAGKDTSKPALNERELAKASFEAARMDYISLLEETTLKPKVKPNENP